jgi:translation initiation factor 1
MTDLGSLSAPFDPFADAAGALDGVGGEGGLEQGKVHIRIQQRNGRKCITTVTGLSKKLDLKKIQKAIKKEHCCNGTVLKDEESGQEVLQFQGDQRDAVKTFLIKEEISDKESIKVHGF